MLNLDSEWRRVQSWYKYEGLIPHDFRRSALRNLISAGVGHAQAMKITGHRTVCVFERYNIVSAQQLHEAVARVTKNATTTQNVVPATSDAEQHLSL